MTNNTGRAYTVAHIGNSTSRPRPRAIARRASTRRPDRRRAARREPAHRELAERRNLWQWSENHPTFAWLPPYSVQLCITFLQASHTCERSSASCRPVSRRGRGAARRRVPLRRSTAQPAGLSALRVPPDSLLPRRPGPPAGPAGRTVPARTSPLRAHGVRVPPTVRDTAVTHGTQRVPTTRAMPRRSTHLAPA